MNAYHITQPSITVTTASSSGVVPIPLLQSGSLPRKIQLVSDTACLVKLVPTMASVVDQSVTSLTITAAGSYTSALPTISFSGTGSGAAATPIFQGATTAITAGGTGYALADVLTTSGGTAYNANFSNSSTWTVSALGVQSATLGSGGTGGTYAVNDVLTVSGGTGTAATITVNTVSAGVILTFTLTTKGNYTVLPSNPVSVTGGGGTGATFNLTFGVITAATVATVGAYLTIPANPVTPTGGTGTAATLTITYGVGSAVITNPGTGYTSAPTATFSSGAATATAVIGSNGILITANPIVLYLNTTNGVNPFLAHVQVTTGAKLNIRALDDY